MINLIKEQDIYIPDYERMEVSETLFSTYDIERLRVLPLMFQTGYLTIKGYEERTRLYELGFPNKEVKVSFNENLYYEMSGLREDSRFKKVGLMLEEGKVDEAIELIKGIFSEIPYTLMRKDRVSEEYFHMMFYLIIVASGVWGRAEVLTSRGRIDMVIETKGRIYIVEFKCGQSAQRAIEQIKEKGYHRGYDGIGKEVYLLGINFLRKEKTISDYHYERIS